VITKVYEIKPKEIAKNNVLEQMLLEQKPGRSIIMEATFSFFPRSLK
jgi:hypothetical protein